MHHPEAEAPVRERDDLVRATRPADVAPGVGDDHDLELEPFRGVDRQQADRAATLLLGDRLELLRAKRVLLADEANEALDVGAANRLVVARKAAELAEVREATRPVPAREHREVVVVLGDDPLAQLLEPDARRGAHEALVALEERAEQALVARLELLRQGPLERREERPARRVATKQHEGVVRDADERRREHGRESDVVVAVVQQSEVREQVDDLLLAEVAAAGRAIRRQPLAPQRLLVLLRIGARGEEDDDLARIGLARVDELADARERSAAPRPVRQCSGSSGEARLVGDEQLHRMPEDRVRETPRTLRAAGSRRRTRRRRGG